MLEEKIADLRSKCVNCGRCTKVCPSFRHGGIDPHSVMSSGTGDLSKCINCGNCSHVCKNTDPMAVIKGLIYLAKNGDFGDVFERTGNVMPLFHDASRNELIPDWNGDDVHIMPGCVVRCRASFLEYATFVAVKSLGLSCRELNGSGCCLHPAQFSNYTEEERYEYKSKMVANSDGKTILSLCAGCSSEFSAFENVENIIPFFYRYKDRLPKSTRSFKVAIEPGCEAMDLADEMRSVVSSMGFEVIDNEMGCCGKNAPVSKPLMAEREGECAGCDVIVVACPMCFTKYDLQRNGRPVMYLTELIAYAAGDAGTLKYHKIKVDPAL